MPKATEIDQTGLKLVVAIGAVLIPAAAAAHPEHFSGGDFGLVHFVTDPLHIALTGAAALLLLAVQWSTRPKPLDQPLLVRELPNR